MGREIRRVLPTWEHPKAETNWGDDEYHPQNDSSYEDAVKEYEDSRITFDEKTEGCTFVEYYGEEPDINYYMYKGPKPSEEELTHYQYYENVSEGTPLSPAFRTPEELAKWLTENCDGVYIPKGTNDQFMKFIDDGWAPSMVMTQTSDGRTFTSEVNGIPVGN